MMFLLSKSAKKQLTVMFGHILER